MSTTDEKQSQFDASSTTPNTKSQKQQDRWMYFVGIGGILLPILAVIVELSFRICSSMFDPLPSILHIVLYLMIPVANAFAIWAYLKQNTRYLALITFLMGLAIGTAFVYSLQFLPGIPFSIIAIIFMGIGFLGLSPFFALAASIISIKNLGRMSLGGHKKAMWMGIAASVLMLGCYIGTEYATIKGLEMASSDNEARSRGGVQIIRSFGNKATLLRACYSQPSGIFIFGNFENRLIDRDKARSIYYRVTGDPFNSVPAPKLIGPRARWVEDFEFDSDVGGTAVNSIVRDLSMSASRMDTVVDPDALTSYTEWVLEFKNNSTNQREARAEIALPHGGVVSRLTLWVHGEEREAAFSTRGKVRAAYENVAVVQRRDPVLVTTCGPDRVMMQCFPVPPNGGTMKVRLGITAPLEMEGRDRASFALPRFVERNFGTVDGLKHSLYLESKRNLALIPITSNPTTGNLNKKTITLTAADADLQDNRVVCMRDEHAELVSTPDMLEPKRYAIIQRVSPAEVKTPENVVIVIDGSKCLGYAREEIADAIKELPPSCKFSVIAAGDEVAQLTPHQLATPVAISSAWEAVRYMRYVGGVDNRPALLKACDTAWNSKNGIVLWIHGPQPLSSGSYSERLKQLVEHKHPVGGIVAVSAADGRNSILAELETTPAVNVFARKGTLGSDLKRLFMSWKSNKGMFSVMRWREPAGTRYFAGNLASSHVARLWAYAEAMKMCYADSRRIPEASQLAAGHQLVTPVSGAVVLETEQQYKEAGLKPVSPHSVPSAVPEPASWLALISGVGLFAMSRLRGKNSMKQ